MDDRSTHRAIRYLFGEILDKYNLKYRVSDHTEEMEGWWKVYEFTGDERAERDGVAEAAGTALEDYIQSQGLDDPERNKTLCFRLLLWPGIEFVNSTGVLQPTIYVDHE